jgi:hypothetical protein
METRRSELWLEEEERTRRVVEEEEEVVEEGDDVGDDASAGIGDTGVDGNSTVLPLLLRVLLEEGLLPLLLLQGPR